METSLFIAKILGPAYLIVALGILFNQKAYQTVMEDFCKNAALTMFNGMLAFVVGLVIVLTHNIWTAGWPAILTIMGWAAIVKGAWLLLLPRTVLLLMAWYQKQKNILVIHAVLALAIGAVLCTFGYGA